MMTFIISRHVNKKGVDLSPARLGNKSSPIRNTIIGGQQEYPYDTQSTYTLPSGPGDGSLTMSSLDKSPVAFRVNSSTTQDQLTSPHSVKQLQYIARELELENQELWRKINQLQVSLHKAGWAITSLFYKVESKSSNHLVNIWLQERGRGEAELESIKSTYASETQKLEQLLHDQMERNEEMENNLSKSRDEKITNLENQLKMATELGESN